MARNRTLALDQRNKKFLGVCAGLANYLGVEPWSVRVVFIASIFFGGWFLIPLYFACWFLLDEASSSVRHSLTDNLAVKHFRTVDYRKKMYRNKREAKWLGVCAGLADYLEVNVFAIRMIFLLLFFTTGGFPLLFYLAAWMVLDKRPEDSYDELNRGPQQAGQEHGAGTESAMAGAGAQAAGARGAGRHEAQVGPDDLHQELRSKRREIKYCARKFLSLQSRMARMEAYVTSNRFKLHREFRTIS